MEIPPQAPNAPPPRLKNDDMYKAAVAFEANFLTEMLKFGGHGESRETFGGGAGEDAFASMMVREQATMIAENGGVGLAEHIVEALIRSAKND